jgi:hypothetical protein
MWPFKKKSRTFVDSVVLLGTDSTWTPVAFGADSEEAAITASIYGASALVTNCRAAATLGARVQRRDGSRWVDDSSSQLDEWVAAPCLGAGEAWDWGDLIEWLLLCLYLRGRGCSKIITAGADDDRLVALQPLDSALVVGDRHPSGELRRWLLTGGGELAPRSLPFGGPLRRVGCPRGARLRLELGVRYHHRQHIALEQGLSNARRQDANTLDVESHVGDTD